MNLFFIQKCYGSSTTKFHKLSLKIRNHVVNSMGFMGVSGSELYDFPDFKNDTYF